MQWFNIKDWEGYYKISKNGQIKSMGRITASRSVSECLIKPRIQNSGYLYVSFYKNNKGKNYLLHRLIAMTFIPNPNKYEFVNHKNGIKTDNRIENLEWCTKGQNQIHAYANGLKKITDKHLDRLINWNKTLHAVPVSQYSLSGEFIRSFSSMTEASISTGLDYNSLVDCVRGKHKHCGGFIFKPIPNEIKHHDLTQDKLLVMQRQ